MSAFRYLFLAGERSVPDDIDYAKKILGVPVVDNWWQTELGWPAISGCAGIELLPVKAGSATKPVPGYHIDYFDEDGQSCPAGNIGNLVIKRSEENTSALQSLMRHSYAVFCLKKKKTII